MRVQLLEQEFEQYFITAHKKFYTTVEGEVGKTVIQTGMRITIVWGRVSVMGIWDGI